MVNRRNLDPLKDLGEYIREQRRQAELSLRKLADLAQVSDPYLSQIERGLKRPSAEILQQIARALEVSAESLYVRAGILDEDRDSNLIASIRAQSDLTTEQKQVLIRIYRSFLLENEDPDPSAAAAAETEET
ncbi:MAG: helix-turn-helix transcriptional regulator [Acidimicrobiaceae bacterium]|nr:helix-turn-helix transcriptional regulator [Acidimicrobiaceae bacterium]MXW60943.1 helix-turn-helix transcriptional regulator [Acidimicrobiaceae bacterium]MXW76160.1 helix-turn-helix transcriptional regulator [Acidimicrobiaceae bacterium]MYA75777.1 helix-turn-helix transcriptional regulator [Acidimicrobiaceae bacterium]MYC41923.1 helix-turn-helix transcriptional regulator [Acidimicrobiaceae bacterium]